MKPIIYLDLDETLVHSIPDYDGTVLKLDEDVFKILDIQLFNGAWTEPELYKTIVRPYALDFVNKLKELKFDIKICTAATTYYAISILKQGNFPFDRLDIYDRDDVQTLKNQNNKPKRNSILVDNLDSTHVNTQHKLEALGENCKLITIPSFDLKSLDANHEQIFNSIIEQITNLSSL